MKNTSHSKSPMTRGGHVAAIAVLGLPLIGGHVAQFAIGLTDTVMLGWYGVEALAAVTLASTYFFVLFLFGAGFGFAVMPMVAAAAGAGEDRQIRRCTRMGLWLSLAYCVMVMPLLLYAGPILDMLGQEPVISQMAAGYLRVAGWGIFPALLVMVLKSYLAALERTQIVLWVTLGAAVMNAAVNYALIFGNWGAPELGVRGAAIASFSTQVVSFVAIIIYALKVLPEHELLKNFQRPDWEMLRKVFRLGVPIGLTTLSEVSLFAASAVMMGWLGTVALAAHGIAVSLAGLTFMVHLGLSNAATIRSGNAYGRRDRDHMARGGKVVTVMSLVMSVIATVFFLAMPEALMSAFMDGSDPQKPEILAIGVGLMAMAALFQLVDGVQAIALGLLRGVQDTTVPMVIGVFSYWGVGMSGSYLLGFVFGYGGVGVWMGLVLGLSCASVLLMLRFWGVVIGRVGEEAGSRQM
ncbi:MATE family efflux transporter [Parasedimentitalea psychrophila]|uniref:Multidrug-efflux transporter n=1 Tax=Parasedimentitalea psychrophila TaxID=2997337 RepID=A0A9Y2P5V8_9RHOB|nr:MATE family efflux transporter [Parasedimentitalea psychrophila]WIY24015.1 MATE family efflux transporter [Parasedimentitalea psychrophila]